MSDEIFIELKKDQVLCVEGEQNSDLYLIDSGRLLVCLRKRSEVTPLAYLEKGDFFGELSFFDGMPRSADVVAVEDCRLVKIPQNQKNTQFPEWIITIAQSMAKRIRLADDIIRKHGLKRKNVNSIQPLPMEEQGRIFRLIKAHLGPQKS